MSGQNRNEFDDQNEFQKRVVSGEIKYHSRDAAPEPESEAPRRKLRFGGVFKNNPTLLIILLDIVLVLVILVIVFPLIRPDSEVDNFLGYEISLHGYLNQGEVQVSLVMQPNPSRLMTTAEELQIEFRVLESNSSVQTSITTAAAGAKSLETRIVRERIVLPNEYETAEEVSIRATISGSEERLTLEKKMRQ
ncbi:MAG: hypothetical protein ACOCZA_08625 [Spirochaetota bacterium]